MNDFVRNHPWLTFILGLAAIDGVVALVHGRPSFPVAALGAAKITPATTPALPVTMTTATK
jgi:hypothetical protein